METPGKNAWASPGPAEFDFRSDVVTTPTISMLAAIQATTLLDDVFEEDKTTKDLECLVADLTGKEAALLVLSGTMGNQVSLRAHLGGPPQSIVCDHRAHVVLYEAGGSASLCGALIKAVVPANKHHLTLEDVQANASIIDDVHYCPTRVVCLENTLNGTIMPLDECRRISAWARQHGLLVHLDGARLWEAVAAGGGSLKDYCSCFDSVSLCFSKGLGAPIGSIVVGCKAFIQKARWARKMLGGGTRQAGVISAPARVSVEETFLGGKLAAAHDKARDLGRYWQELGGTLAEPVETNMLWINLESISVKYDDVARIATGHGIRAFGDRFVVHYQVSDEAISRLKSCMKALINHEK
jgi:threonine aldolase